MSMKPDQLAQIRLALKKGQANPKARLFDGTQPRGTVLEKYVTYQKKANEAIFKIMLKMIEDGFDLADIQVALGSVGQLDWTYALAIARSEDREKKETV